MGRRSHPELAGGLEYRDNREIGLRSLFERLGTPRASSTINVQLPAS